MNREELRAILGDENADIEAKITGILNKVHTEEDEANEETKANDKPQAKVEEDSQDKALIANLQKQLAESKKTLKKLQQDNQDNEGLQSTINQNQATIEKLSKQLEETKILSAVTAAAYKYGAKNPSHVAKLIDMTDLKINKNGDVIGIDEQFENLKKDGAYLFGETEEEPKKATRQKYNPVKGEKAEGPSLGSKLAKFVNEEQQPSQNAFLDALK